MNTVEGNIVGTNTVGTDAHADSDGNPATLNAPYTVGEVIYIYSKSTINYPKIFTSESMQMQNTLLQYRFVVAYIIINCKHINL